MAFQTLTIDLNANLQKLQGDLDHAQQISDQAYARITNSANAAGTAIGDAANQADFGPLSKDAAAAAASMDQLKASTTGTGAAADQAKTKLAALFEEIDKKAGESYDSLASKGKVVGTAISVGIGLLLAGTVAGVIYGAVKAVEALGNAFNDFVVTGEGYKSKNIDALDEQDKKVRQLQTDLLTTAEAASALDLAFKQTGTQKDDYTSVYNATAEAIRKATDEQEKLNKAVADARQTNDGDKIAAAEKAVEQYSNAFKDLGIQYQDASGKTLSTTAIISNSAKALGDYAQGYDRNAAAAALAIGSYSKVVNAAKINADAFGTAQSRLKDYFLVIGPTTQAALDDYHKAVAGFKTESDLMSQGFKAAIADAILPQLAGLADYFKDGFPSAVGAFRDVLTAAVAALEFFKTGVYTISQPVIAAFEAIGIGAAAGMLAVQKALHFDFSGALHELDEGRKAILDRFSQLPEEVGARVALAEKNINLARGTDSQDANAKLGDKPVDTGAGKTFTGLRTPPADDKAAAAAKTNVDVAKKLLEQQLKDLDLFISDEKTQLTERDEFLSLYYQHSDISIRDYFAQRKTAQDDFVASAKKGYNEEIADLQAYIAKTQGNSGITDDQKTARVTDAQTKLIEVRNKLRKVEADANQETLKDWFANRTAVEQYGDSLKALEAQIATSSGDSAGAFAINFEAQNRNLTRQLNAVLNSDSSTQADRNKAQQGIVDLDQIRQQGIATAKLNDLSSARSVILGDLANAQARIDLAVQNGQKTELQGLEDTSAANKARIPVLEQIAAAYEAIAAASNSPQDKLNAETARVELDKLKSQTDLVADAFNQAGRDVTANFFDKLSDRTLTLKQKLQSLFDDISNRILKQGENVISNWLFGKDTGVLSNLGTQFQSLFSPSSGSGAVSAASTSAAANIGKLTGSTSQAANDAAFTALNLTLPITDTAMTTLGASAIAASSALDALAVSSGGSSAASGSGGIFASLLSESAKGNLFDRGNVIPFARGAVINQATVMPMALMGEAGPEVIMPVRRMANGNMGVAVAGGGQQQGGSNNFYINVPPVQPRDLSTSRQNAENIRRAIGF